MEQTTGRPSLYSQEVADAICEHIAHGKSLVSYCSQDGAPGYSTVMRWLTDNETFRDKYVRAREAQADYLAEEIVQIADDGLNDTYEVDGETRVNQDVVARSRLRVDARKWYAARMAPKKYGDKVQTELTGANGGPVQVEAIAIEMVSPKREA
jgi:hypothetical protein